MRDRHTERESMRERAIGYPVSPAWLTKHQTLPIISAEYQKGYKPIITDNRATAWYIRYGTVRMQESNRASFFRVLLGPEHIRKISPGIIGQRLSNAKRVPTPRSITAVGIGFFHAANSEGHDRWRGSTARNCLVEGRGRAGEWRNALRVLLARL